MGGGGRGEGAGTKNLILVFIRLQAGGVQYEYCASRAAYWLMSSRAPPSLSLVRFLCTCLSRPRTPRRLRHRPTPAARRVMLALSAHAVTHCRRGTRPPKGTTEPVLLACAMSAFSAILAPTQLGSQGRRSPPQATPVIRLSSHALPPRWQCVPWAFPVGQRIRMMRRRMAGIRTARLAPPHESPAQRANQRRRDDCVASTAALRCVATTNGRQALAASTASVRPHDGRRHRRCACRRSASSWDCRCRQAQHWLR